MKLKGKVVMSCAAALMLSPLALAEPALEFSGLVEVEAFAAEDYTGARTTDVTLATVGVAMSAIFDERASARLAFLYEEDATDFGLEEGTVTFGLNESTLFTAGKMYVPFGRFDSFMVSDPQTLVMSETVETVLMLSAKNKGFYGSAYLFNGDSEEISEVEKGDDSGISAGFNLGYARDGRFDVGVSYISNIADSDTLQALEDDPHVVDAIGMVDSQVAGAGAYFIASLGSVSVLGEYLTALEHFSNGDLDGTVTMEEQPSASNIEIAAELGDRFAVAAAYQKTTEARFIGLPETVVSAAVAYKVAEGATLAAEYARMKDYTSGDGGTGESASSFTVQLALGF